MNRPYPGLIAGLIGCLALFASSPALTVSQQRQGRCRKHPVAQDSLSIPSRAWLTG